jgi:exodeoxyribonuclease V alpha subunit
MTLICGVVEKITYINEESGFVVAKLQETGKKGLTTIIGNLKSLHPGESLKLSGTWVNHSRFGEQFQVDHMERVVPETLNGVTRYLGSGLIKGIGPQLAERIVAKFGHQTLEIIQKSPERLTEVTGVGPKRVEMIAQAWEEQKEIQGVMIFLQGHGVSPTYSAKIYRQYGGQSVEVVKENPYRLAEDIPGIGFLTADRIAQSIGTDLNSPVRARAAILHVLNEIAGEGHVYYPRQGLALRVQQLLRIDPELIISGIDHLSGQKTIFIEETADPGHDRVYLAPLYAAETGIGHLLEGLRDSPSRIRSIHAEKAIDWVEKKLGIKLAAEQKEAVQLATASKVLVVTGGPGTGKTTLILAVLRIFQQLTPRIVLAAPTGRAAKRMGEATGREAKTIHRLLEYSPKTGGFSRNEDDPLEADVVIIDEVSMVDTLLMYHLLKAIPLQSHFILVGDVDQLPSVGPGTILKDIIDSRAFTVVRLTEIFRQSQESTIVVNAHRINRGEMPMLKNESRQERGDFYFIEEDDPGRTVDKIVDLCTCTLPERFGLDSTREIQVMAPMHRGPIGVTNLNAELQKALNPGGPGLTQGGKLFKVGDKVMQITNNYGKDVFNGDLGWITGIDAEDHRLVIDFDGRPVPYDFSELDEVIPAYAISVHKSQGSEYPAVIVPISTQHYLLLQRNLLYTAITRAKRLVVLIGTRKALAMAIRNNKPQQRYTWLAERLRGA